jgi:hypothetical protein
MPLTRSFKELVQRQVAEDPAYAEALLREGIDTMLAGDVEAGKAILRDYIKATIGFEKLGEATGAQPKSLIRMFGPRGTQISYPCNTVAQDGPDTSRTICLSTALCRKSNGGKIGFGSRLYGDQARVRLEAAARGTAQGLPAAFPGRLNRN